MLSTFLWTLLSGQGSQIIEERNSIVWTEHSHFSLSYRIIFFLHWCWWFLYHFELQVLFVCTANVIETIPNPLLDRMEIISIAGYIADEKMHIARDYLEKNTREACGIKPEEVSFCLLEFLSGRLLQHNWFVHLLYLSSLLLCFFLLPFLLICQLYLARLQKHELIYVYKMTTDNWKKKMFLGWGDRCSTSCSDWELLQRSRGKESSEANREDLSQG